MAAGGRRSPCPLFHAALEVDVDGGRFVIEMAPAWGSPRSVDRGVVVTGPVGLRALGRSRFFRYEIRRWRGGVLSDRGWAVGQPVVVTTDAAAARRLLRAVEDVPDATWGRDAAGARDMWSSNSVVSWLLASIGADRAALAPPAGGRAPGWDAGWVVSGRARDGRRSPRP